MDLGDDDRAEWEEWGNRAALDLPATSVSIPELFGRWVVRDPGAVAVSCGGRAVTYRGLDEVSIPELFGRWVVRDPGAVAVSCGGRAVTYRGLDEASNRLAHVLVGHGAGPGRRVALLFSRSVEAVVAIMAVLKTGAAYVPIDPSVPDARLGFVLSDAEPVVAVSTAVLAGRVCAD
ncbi:AMP-binding protein [Mycobacteroides immunogenum]|nr:AMP-binding protein [Mycobacteroides immunogenum]